MERIATMLQCIMKYAGNYATLMQAKRDMRANAAAQIRAIAEYMEGIKKESARYNCR